MQSSQLNYKKGDIIQSPEVFLDTIHYCVVLLSALSPNNIMFKIHRNNIINFKSIIKIQFYELRLFLQTHLPKSQECVGGKENWTVLLCYTLSSVLLYMCHNIIWMYERAAASDAAFAILTKDQIDVSGIFTLFCKGKEKGDQMQMQFII